jgi:DNA-binding transcriptional ArsR family regulator
MDTPDENGNLGRGAAGSLTHPMRRRILRYLHRCDEPKNASEVAKALDQPISQISYHLKALESDGTTREVGPASGDSPTYESSVKEDDEVLELLEATEANDEDESREAA